MTGPLILLVPTATATANATDSSSTAVLDVRGVRGRRPQGIPKVLAPLGLDPALALLEVAPQRKHALAELGEPGLAAGGGGAQVSGVEAREELGVHVFDEHPGGGGRPQSSCPGRGGGRGGRGLLELEREAPLPDVAAAGEWARGRAGRVRVAAVLVVGECVVLGDAAPDGEVLEAGRVEIDDAGPRAILGAGEGQLDSRGVLVDGGMVEDGLDD